MEGTASVYGFSYFLQNEASTKEKYAARTGQVGAKYVQNSIFPTLLSPSGDLGIGLVWDNHPDQPTPPHRLFGPTVEILFKLN